MADDRLRLRTVRGDLDPTAIRRALAHEHIFVDFQPTTSSGYMAVDWGMVRGAGVARLRELNAQGIDLLVDWTAPGVGRNALLLRDVATASGVEIICPTGVYLAKRPPAWMRLDTRALADRFIEELTDGIDGSGVRSGFIKIAASDDGPTDDETEIHRAAAIAAAETGAAVGVHATSAPAFDAVRESLVRDGVPADRLIWAHAQRSSQDAHLRAAADGAVIQFDSFTRRPSDGTDHVVAALDGISALVDASHGDRVLVSEDDSVVVSPATAHYGYDSTAIMREMRPRLRDRIGDRATRAILRDNVLRAFRWS